MLEELRDAGRGLGAGPPLSQGTSPLRTPDLQTANLFPESTREAQEALLWFQHSAMSVCSVSALYLLSTDAEKPGVSLTFSE